jgi:cysteine desulfurase
MKVYLDNAATTPMLPQVVDAMLPFMCEHFGNPSSSHSFGRKTKTAIEQSRRAIAARLHCPPSSICFTSGGTEADNLALYAAVEHQGCRRILTLPSEHSAVIKTAERYGQTGAATCALIPMDDTGHVNLSALDELLADGPKTLVSVMHGNNEVGLIQDLNAIGSVCRTHGALFHSDTVQTMGHYPLDLSVLPVDFATCSAHKIHGPKGIGFLYVREGLKVGALILGGSQERAMRGGTENLIGIVGLAEAIKLAFDGHEEHEKHVRALKRRMVEGLVKSIPGIRFNVQSDRDYALYTVLNVSFPPHRKNGMLMFLLDLEGVACSGGSACSSGSPRPSHVLEALNCHDPNRVALRFSFSRLTTEAEIDYTVEACARILGHLTQVITPEENRHRKS